MKSQSYIVSRIFTQIFAFLAILSNVAALIIIFYSGIEEVEVSFPTKPILLFCDLGTYMCAMNILFSIMGACCITSKFKLWMAMCQKVLFTQVAFNICTIVYFSVWYCSSMMNCLHSLLIKNEPAANAIISKITKPSFGVQSIRFEEHMIFYTRIYNGLQIISTICSIIIIKILRYTINIKLEIKERPIPRILDASQIGTKTKIVELKTVPVGLVAVN